MWSSATLSSGEEAWSVLGAFSRESGGEDACEKSVTKANDRAKNDERSKRFRASYICLPDTVDPRAPKGSGR